MEYLKLLIVLVGGFVAGFVNIMAGGGSLLTLPLLIFVGLPSAVANGTNRLGILIQSATGSLTFHKKGIHDYKFGIQLAVPAIIGALIGANIAVELPDAIFNKILAGVMVFVMLLIIIRPQKYIKAHGELTLRRRILAIIAFFIVGLYGGFIQAGVGFIIMVALSLLTPFALIKVNSIKVFVVAIYTAFAFSIFIINGKIDLIYGILLAIGNAAGAWIGVHASVKKGDILIKVILVLMITAMAVKLFFFS